MSYAGQWRTRSPCFSRFRQISSSDKSFNETCSEALLRKPHLYSVISFLRQQNLSSSEILYICNNSYLPLLPLASAQGLKAGSAVVMYLSGVQHEHCCIDIRDVLTHCPEILTWSVPVVQGRIQKAIKLGVPLIEMTSVLVRYCQNNSKIDTLDRLEGDWWNCSKNFEWHRRPKNAQKNGPQNERGNSWGKDKTHQSDKNQNSSLKSTQEHHTRNEKKRRKKNKKSYSKNDQEKALDHSQKHWPEKNQDGGSKSNQKNLPHSHQTYCKERNIRLKNKQKNIVANAQGNMSENSRKNCSKIEPDNCFKKDSRRWSETDNVNLLSNGQKIRLKDGQVSLLSNDQLIRLEDDQVSLLSNDQKIYSEKNYKICSKHKQQHSSKNSQDNRLGNDSRVNFQLAFENQQKTKKRNRLLYNQKNRLESLQKNSWGSFRPEYFEIPKNLPSHCSKISLEKKKSNVLENHQDNCLGSNGKSRLKTCSVDNRKNSFKSNEKNGLKGDKKYNSKNRRRHRAKNIKKICLENKQLDCSSNDKRKLLNSEGSIDAKTRQNGQSNNELANRSKSVWQNRLANDCGNDPASDWKNNTNSDRGNRSESDWQNRLANGCGNYPASDCTNNSNSDDRGNRSKNDQQSGFENAEQNGLTKGGHNASEAKEQNLSRNGCENGLKSDSQSFPENLQLDSDQGSSLRINSKNSFNSKNGAESVWDTIKNTAWERLRVFFVKQ